ncbi:hypothetical protein GXW78_18230 [Roseomonas terrae]|uniref:Uncharacterized protein n=1 Tax=Neoroseomonas terrae TaxID=424799 RepID=A0ABS5EKR8_9PROT|nr:hypothetical protein [Neoroseomonas terrae]MBR0651614.1 hypothetical protein [Neoroseomonas terrae]
MPDTDEPIDIEEAIRQMIRDALVPIAARVERLEEVIGRLREAALAAEQDRLNTEIETA